MTRSVAKVKSVSIPRVKSGVADFIQADSALIERAKDLIVAAGGKSDFWVSRGGLPLSVLREIFGKNDVKLMRSLGLISVKAGRVVVCFTVNQLPLGKLQ